MGAKEVGSLGLFFSGFKDGFKSFGNSVTVVVNTVLLALVYFFAVGPVSLVAKARRKEFLDISRKRRESHWEELGLGKKDIEEYYRQF